MKLILPVGLALAAAAALIALARAVYFAFIYRVFAEELTCEEIPPGSTVLALGFEHDGEVNGTIRPGAGNTFLAWELAHCAARLERVVTQKAISDAMQQEGLLDGGRLLGQVPVQPMHPHDPTRPVRTYAALKQALDGLDPLPGTLLLLAHDRHIERAYWDLQSLYNGHVILWKLNDVPYASPGWVPALKWALRELYIARPVDAWLRRQARS